MLRANPVTAALSAHRAASPSATAFTDAAGRELTYLDLWQASTAIASRLRAMPTGRATVVVAVVSSTASVLDYACAYFGVLLAGHCELTVPTGDPAALRLAEPDIVIDARSPGERRTPLTGMDNPVAVIDALRDEKATADRDVQAEPVDPQAPAEILHTSGTTGKRKGVIVTYGDIASDLTHERWSHRKQRGSVLHALALGSTPAQSMLLEPLRPHGYSVHVLNQDISAFIRTARRTRPTSTVLVPTMALRIAAALSQGADPLPSFRSVRVVSAPIRPADLRLVAAAFPNAKVTNVYTSTESWPADVALDVVIPAGRSSATWRSSPGVRVVSPAGKPLLHGSAGIVELRRPGQRRHYLSGRYEDGTLRTLPITMQDDWIRTGDVGRIDDQDQLTWLGRAGEVLNIGGLKITRSAIEEAVREVMAVGEVVAFGLPHPTLGQYVAVAVSPADVDGDDIRRQVSRRLPPQCVPRRIVCVESLPRTGNGALDRTAAKDLFLSRRDRSARERV